MKLGEVTHVLFDMDGLLLDTERLYSVAIQQILSRFDMEFTWEVKRMMMGRKAADAAEVMLDTYGLHGQLSAEDFLRQKDEILRDLFPKCNLMPGVLDLLNHLHKNGIPMAVATSSHRDNFELKVQNHGHVFEKFFSHVVTGNQVESSKPAPDIFLLASKKFEEQVHPSNVLVFEDAPVGVEAALAANMNVVMVSSAINDHDGAHQKLNSMKEFSPETWGLPPYPKLTG